MIGQQSSLIIETVCLVKLTLIFQVIEAAMIFKVDEEGMPLEASLGINLRHPNIVLLLDYATHFALVILHQISRKL